MVVESNFRIFLISRGLCKGHGKQIKIIGMVKF